MSNLAEADVLELVLGDHIHLCSSSTTAEVIVALSKREGERYRALAAELLRKHGNSSIETTVAARSAKGFCEAFDQILQGRNIEALRIWTRREDFDVHQAKQLGKIKDREIQAYRAIVLVEDTGARIAAGRNCTAEARAGWARRDRVYRDWLTAQTWFDPTEGTGDLDEYLPTRIEAEWATFFSALIRRYTNLDEVQRNAIRKRLTDREKSLEVDDAIVALWGESDIVEIEDYVVNTYMEPEADQAWGMFKRLFHTLGKASAFGAWEDASTLRSALNHPRTRAAGLRSRHLKGSELDNEVGRVLAGVGVRVGEDATALCANCNLTPQTADLLAEKTEGAGIYMLHRSNMGPVARARILERDRGLVEALHLLQRSCVIGEVDMGEMGVWFDPAVIDAFIHAHAERGSGEHYAKYANVAISLHPEKTTALARGVRVRTKLTGAIAAAVAAELAGTENPEVLSGLLLRWNGTVETLCTAAGKL